MNRNIIIANRLREVLINGHWIANTNYKQQLLNTTWQQSTQKVGSLNSIAALIFHINYYTVGLLNVLKGRRLEISDEFSFNAPPIQSEKEWKDLVDSFLINAKEFIEKIEQMPDAQFDIPFVDAKYGDYLRNIEGMIEHCYYHLGQIVLIKKMLIEGSKI